MGESPEQAAKDADTVLRIETKLAEASRTPVQLRDRENNYNKKTLAELGELAPKLNWDLYWKGLDVGGFTDVIVGQPEFFQRVSELLGSVPAADWQTYLRWRLIHSTAPYLSDPFEQENFHFYGQEMRGVKQMRPRWKRVIGTIDGTMGEALGQLYVEKYFSPESKKRMDQLVKNVMAAYKERIESRDWMSPETKQQALAKLATVMPKIGYPDKWRDYSKLEVGTDSYVQNVMRAEAFETRYRINKLGKPVDRGEWGMSPPTVNAYYNPSLNEIVFPAGILQPPFFNPAADDAVNYGSIGAVIGHEITHGFDDQGSRSDAQGNLKNWWTAEDRARFNAKTDKLVKQYDDCVAVEDQHVNGKLTLGENIADLGGLTIAYAAYHEIAGRETGAGDRWAHRAAAILHGLCAIVARGHSRRRTETDAADQSALAGSLPDDRAGIERAGVLRCVRHQAGRKNVSSAGRSRGNLVMKWSRSPRVAAPWAFIVRESWLDSTAVVALDPALISFRGRCACDRSRR